MRSENGYGFLRPGLKTGVENSIFWSEIGSGFGDAGGTPPPYISTSTPRRLIRSNTLTLERDYHGLHYKILKRRKLEFLIHFNLQAIIVFVQYL